MPVDSITNTNPVLPTTLQGHVQTSVPLATSPLNTVTNPVAVATAATQNLTPAQQAALAVNETVQTALETQNLTPARQAALAANQATQTLVAPQAVPQTTIPAATGVAGQTPLPGTMGTPPTGTAVGIAATAMTPAATAATAAVATTSTTGTTGTPIANAVPNPALAAGAQPIPYQNAFAVYEVRNPTPPPSDPAPIRKDIHPPLPIGRVRPVDPLVLRQEWAKRKKNKHNDSDAREYTQSRPPLAEKSIRDLIAQTNEDLAASGVPIHLALVKNEEGFTLDVYDCSDNMVCTLSQEVPLDLNNLLTILDTLEHEDGIIVNIKT